MRTNKKIFSNHFKKIAIGIFFLILLLLCVSLVYIVINKKQITDSLCSTLIDVTGSVVEIAGTQPVYVCKNYFLSQDDVRNKYFVSKVAEGLLIARKKQLVKEIRSQISWSGRVKRIAVNSAAHLTKCASMQPNENCQKEDVYLDAINLIQLEHIENGEFDFPFFRLNSEMENIFFEFKSADELLYTRVDFQDLLKYIRVGDRVNIEQDLQYNGGQYSNTYRITRF